MGAKLSKGVDPALPAATRKEPRPDAVHIGVDMAVLELGIAVALVLALRGAARARRTKTTGRPGAIQILGT